MTTSIKGEDPALREALWTRACEAVVDALAGPICQGYTDPRALGAAEAADADGGAPARAGREAGSEQ